MDVHFKINDHVIKLFQTFTDQLSHLNLLDIKDASVIGITKFNVKQNLKGKIVENDYERASEEQFKLIIILKSRSGENFIINVLQQHLDETFMVTSCFRYE